MSVGFLTPRVVRVIRGEQWSADTASDIHEIGKDTSLCLDAVILQLDEEVVPAEDLLVPGGGGQRGVEVAHLPLVAFLLRRIRGEHLCDFTTETS